MTAESHIETVPVPPRAGVMTFAVIFSLESMVRSLNSTVISLQAYEILGSSQKVSVLATSVSLTVLILTLFLPILLGRLRRRWAYTLGAVLMGCSALMLASHTLAGQWLGMFLRNTGAAMFNIALSLYILDNIRRQDLTRAEPIRLSLSTFSWMAGPALGVGLLIYYGPWGPQIAVLASLAVLLVVFWYVRLADRSGALPSGT
ncbi:MAG: MFS transporter, partial [Alphaproteobacteria bacterium]|nr:MFS transporter [Alphaproteobacteria bacterium]